MKPGELRQFWQDLGRYRAGDLVLFVGAMDNLPTGGRVATIIHEGQRQALPLYALASYTHSCKPGADSI